MPVDLALRERTQLRLLKCATPRLFAVPGPRGYPQNQDTGTPGAQDMACHLLMASNQFGSLRVGVGVTFRIRQAVNADLTRRQPFAHHVAHGRHGAESGTPLIRQALPPWQWMLNSGVHAHPAGSSVTMDWRPVCPGGIAASTMHLP